MKGENEHWIRVADLEPLEDGQLVFIGLRGQEVVVGATADAQTSLAADKKLSLRRWQARHGRSHDHVRTRDRPGFPQPGAGTWVWDVAVRRLRAIKSGIRRARGRARCVARRSVSCVGATHLDEEIESLGFHRAR